LTVAGAARAQTADATGNVAPIGPGAYPVACSNVEQDFSRVAPGAGATNYWEGSAPGGGYVTDLLTDPAHAFVVDVTLPGDGQLFGSFANRSLLFAALVCYPTSVTNTRPDYALPNGKSVPHMQRDGDLPIFAEDRARFPVLLFSSGLGGSPLSSDYLDAMTLFASHGYVVVAPFHGDARVSDINLSSLNDVVNAVLHFSDYTALQSIRPLALEAELDALLADPAFAARVDANAIGGFGASLGGESLLLMRGARLTVSLGLSSRAIMNDTRLKAAVGYVPYFGQPILPAFGRNQEGLQDMQMPYLAIAGGADVTAPAIVTALGMLQLANVRQFVLLNGVAHGFDVRSAPDIFTWALTYLASYVDDEPLARATSARMTEVAGGGDDLLLLDRFAPLPPGPAQALAVEYYNRSLGHYFVTADPNEIAALDVGAIPGWSRTGDAFKVYVPTAPFGVPACRFYGRPGIGPNSHFFTIDPPECAAVFASPAWIFEGFAFRVDAPDAAGACAKDRVPVVRMYNNGMGGETNHRYLTSHSETAMMRAQGWVLEGTVFCSLP
jgi:predicted dienelactone hydrolase